MATAWLALDLVWQQLLLTLLTLTAACGLLAVVSPHYFAKLASLGGRWVDSQRFVQWLDARIEIDAIVLRHARAFGACVLSAVLFAVVQWIAWQAN